MVFYYRLGWLRPRSQLLGLKGGRCCLPGPAASVWLRAALWTWGSSEPLTANTQLQLGAVAWWPAWRGPGRARVTWVSLWSPQHPFDVIVGTPGPAPWSQADGSVICSERHLLFEIPPSPETEGYTCLWKIWGFPHLLWLPKSRLRICHQGSCGTKLRVGIWSVLFLWKAHQWCLIAPVCVLVAQSCPTLRPHGLCSPPGSSVHWVL